MVTYVLEAPPDVLFDTSWEACVTGLPNSRERPQMPRMSVRLMNLASFSFSFSSFRSFFYGFSLHCCFFSLSDPFGLHQARAPLYHVCNMGLVMILQYSKGVRPQASRQEGSLILHNTFRPSEDYYRLPTARAALLPHTRADKAVAMPYRSLEGWSQCSLAGTLPRRPKLSSRMFGWESSHIAPSALR